MRLYTREYQDRNHHTSYGTNATKTNFPTQFTLDGVVVCSGVRLSPLGTAATTGLLYQPQMVDEGDCGAIGGMKIGRGNRSTRRKRAPTPLSPPQIPHDQTRARTRAAAVGSQRLTAWAMARPFCGGVSIKYLLSILCYVSLINCKSDITFQVVSH
jgi:hypothetical protein